MPGENVNRQAFGTMQDTVDGSTQVGLGARKSEKGGEMKDIWKQMTRIWAEWCRSGISTLLLPISFRRLTRHKQPQTQRVALEKLWVKALPFPSSIQCPCLLGVNLTVSCSASLRNAGCVCLPPMQLHRSSQLSHKRKLFKVEGCLAFCLFVLQKVDKRTRGLNPETAWRRGWSPLCEGRRNTRKSMDLWHGDATLGCSACVLC